ncbi:hypothetical protein ABTM56_20475, partial [Acinetobacter baumannii]
MKKILLFVLFEVCLLAAKSQTDSIVHFTASSQKINDSSYRLTIQSTIKKGWHLYDNSNAKDGLTGVTVSFNNENILVKEA